MASGRSNFGVCTFRNLIFVVGGLAEGIRGVVQTSEVYNVFSDTWHNMPVPDEFCFGMTLETAAKRFVYGFGGLSVSDQKPDSSIERVLRLDYSRTKLGW